MEQNAMKSLKLLSAKGLRLILAAILSASSMAVSSSHADEKPGKATPQAGLPHQTSDGQAPLNSDNQSNFKSVDSGYSGDKPSPADGCNCQRKGLAKRLFGRKCKLHSQIDPSAANINNPFEEIPLGLQLTETMKVQVRNFEDTRQIFYHYDFVDGKPELNFAGRSKLYQVSQNAMSSFAPIIVEATPRQPGLDQTRRLNIIQSLANNAIPIPGERVIVNGPQARGTVGPDALILYNKSLDSLNNGVGGMGASGGGGVGGLSGSGLLPNMQQAGGGDN
jgi:hypothetical protein